MKDWEEKLNFFKSEEYTKLKEFLYQERLKGKSILPSEDDIFNAIKYTPLKKVKAVIIGQDPYPNKRHAHGLAFSIPKMTKDIPKSLKNILKELKNDIGITATSGNLYKWAKEGVILLNTVLTIEEGKSNSHKGKGWEILTKEIVSLINKYHNNIVFILWGNKAQKMKKLIAQDKHLVIKSPHPSPLSAYRGFWESKPFSKTNNYLKKSGKEPINWKI